MFSISPAQTYALEHTVVEAFDGQIHKDVDFAAEAQAAIIVWVREAAAAMHAECPAVPTRSRGPHGHESHRRGTVEGVDLHLHREIGWSLPEVAYGRVFCGRFAPLDYETLRIGRMCAAVAKKLPKLQSWRHRGAVRAPPRPVSVEPRRHPRSG